MVIGGEREVERFMTVVQTKSGSRSDKRQVGRFQPKACIDDQFASV